MGLWGGAKLMRSLADDDSDDDEHMDAGYDEFVEDQDDLLANDSSRVCC